MLIVKPNKKLLFVTVWYMQNVTDIYVYIIYYTLCVWCTSICTVVLMFENNMRLMRYVCYRFIVCYHVYIYAFICLVLHGARCIADCSSSTNVCLFVFWIYMFITLNWIRILNVLLLWCIYCRRRILVLARLWWVIWWQQTPTIR